MRTFRSSSKASSRSGAAELAAAAGVADVPSAGGDEGRIVARLDSESEAREGEEIELFVDLSKLHLFDLETGRNITVREREPAAA